MAWAVGSAKWTLKVAATGPPKLKPEKKREEEKRKNKSGKKQKNRTLVWGLGAGVTTFPNLKLVWGLRFGEEVTAPHLPSKPVSAATWW